MFRFDWERVQGETVEAILARDPQVMSTGATSSDAIYLRLARCAIEIGVNVDTDELILTLLDGPPPPDVSPLAPLQDLVGRPLGWAWEARNQQGYEDGLLVSFSGYPLGSPKLGRGSPVTPDVMFIGEGSAVALLRMSAV